LKKANKTIRNTTNGVVVPVHRSFQKTQKSYYDRIPDFPLADESIRKDILSNVDGLRTMPPGNPNTKQPKGERRRLRQHNIAFECPAQSRKQSKGMEPDSGPQASGHSSFRRRNSNMIAGNTFEGTRPKPLSSEGNQGLTLQ
jgi:hypothetical protein